MPKQYAAIIGGIAAAFAFAAIVIGFIWFCKTHCKNLYNKNNSDTGSSDPSAIGTIPSSSTQGLAQGATQFSLEELEQATKNFSESNLIGYGSLGPVYKGLVRDTIVAIKRRVGSPHPGFLTEVTYLSEVRHRHLVSLLGYYYRNGYQMLVYEYLPNRSMCNHLYDAGAESSTKLEFKQRLSIALGAAKGLHHLHSLNPPLLHKNFKTANVLVDENFNAKVADAGISRLLEMIEEAGPSQVQKNAFQDPEVGSVSGNFTEASDVYSFGVFLLELVTGQEASQNDALGSNESLIQWVASRLSSDTFVDRRMAGGFTREGMRDLLRLMLQCLRFPGTRRPRMETVVAELERIHEKERALTTVMGEGPATIILGSELFATRL